VFYLNLALLNAPRYIKRIKFDLIVFDTIFITNHWDRSKFKKLMEKARFVKDMNAVKIVLPQDEFINTDLLCDFINEFDVNYVFSVAPEKEWLNIYHKVNFEKVKFFNVLTGYLDEKAIERISRLSREAIRRNIDIGYRVSAPPLPWFGSHGYLKQRVAEVFLEKAKGSSIVTDISMSQKDSFLGDDWYRFLLRCKYTIGAEGGTSILDRNGDIKRKTEFYLRNHPSADFQELEKNCFPDMDNKFKLFAISPRHLEACLTKTCQVLINGEYNGILKSGVHYIGLKKNFSNIDEVIDAVVCDKKRDEITKNAYSDIVTSGKYTYRSFVDFIIKKSLSDNSKTEERGTGKLSDSIAYCLMEIRELISWVLIATAFHFTRHMRRAYSTRPAR
jgi:hypothetical protein